MLLADLSGKGGVKLKMGLKLDHSIERVRVGENAAWA
jgi:hypothetical protein